MARCRAMTAKNVRCNGKAVDGGLCMAHKRMQDGGKEVVSFYEDPKEDVKPATAPWNAADNPWVPDIFKLKKKHAGFRPRFIEPDNMERRLNEGWAVADARNWVDEETLKKDEEGNVDTTLRRRGMILMEMPEELALQREAYVNHKTDLQDVDAIKQQEYNKLKQQERQSGLDTGLQMIK